MARQTVELSLFWRTFFLLALLLAGGVFAWVQTLRELEFQPRAVEAARQTADLVNLSRTALRTVDAINRVALLKTMSGQQQAVRVQPREPGDRWESYATDRFTQSVTDQLVSQLGPDAVVARSVNGKPGLWVGFSIERDRYWLQTDPAHAAAMTGSTWFVWVGIALVATLLGSVVIARLINRPLRELSFAASRIREGDLDSRLDENTLTSEIREVNRGFNRMARELAKVEEDRAVMLAGISHDLRTPLARLRLETEMSVSNEEAKRNMAMDIEQLDAIIDKFMDYARPGETAMRPVLLAQLVDREAQAFRDPSQIRIQSRLAIDLSVLADDTELGRVFSNLFENARRYGRSTDTGVAVVTVSYAKTGPWVIVTVRDQGPGVAPEKLGELTTPFFRGDAARTAATGAGLGLAIVEKSLQRMGGSLELSNAPEGGLIARLRLKQAPAT
ncbi:MAG: HAMP domain-containing protein [Burkholderiales bacterium]|nr:HAMP domain-containing protein [Burkholderiales bacterium]